MANADLTLSRLHELIEYVPETGLFFWRKSSGRCKAGTLAGTEGGNGYLQISIKKHRNYLHRIAWFYMTGEWPKDDIDHLDGNRSNNRWSNLREATRTINMQNRRSVAANKTSCSLLGAYKTRKHWLSKIRVDGGNIHLGVFDTAEEAHAAYIEAKRRLHPGCTL